MRHRSLNTAMRHEPAPDLAATIERARAGDQAAIRTLIELYQGRVGRFVLAMLGDDSEWEDVAQATFVKMMLGIERLQAGDIFESWLFRIARNASLDHLRRRRWRRLFTSWEPRHGEVAAPREIEDRRLAQVEQALTKLPVDQRELILLMRENDWSYGDLARITGVTATAVKSRLFRARSRLRALMNGDES
ncbi:MAG: RNA polymerase sigma factor [Candidatus Binatus sp.]|jgi:RNA polymerase sigma-70 factor (ECF subfamily)